MKEAIKALETSLKGDKKQADKLTQQAQSAIDTAVKKGVIHKNKAARKKAQLSKATKDAGVKTTKNTAKSTAKPKTTAKKPATKSAPKSTAKTTASKKTATKKATTKKVTTKK